MVEPKNNNNEDDVECLHTCIGVEMNSPLISSTKLTKLKTDSCQYLVNVNVAYGGDFIVDLKLIRAYATHDHG